MSVPSRIKIRWLLQPGQKKENWFRYCGPYYELVLNNLVNATLNLSKDQALVLTKCTEVLLTFNFVKFIFSKFLYHTETDICELVNELKCLENFMEKKYSGLCV